MSTDRFQLRSALKVRAAERDSQRLRVEEADRVVRSLEDRIHVLRQELESLRARTSAAIRQTSLDVKEIVTTYQLDSHLRRELRALEQQRVQASKKADASRSQWVEAGRQVKGLERLLERLEETQRRENLHRESRLRSESLTMRK
jgi:flagellar export protein FliJ